MSDRPEARTATEPLQAFAELNRVLLDTPLLDVLHRVAELARDCLPGVDDTSVTLVEHGRVCSVAFTGQLAASLDERQFELGTGPCLTAALEGTVTSVPDTATEETFAEFAAVARRAGVSAVVSVPLSLPGRSVGGLNLYAPGPAPLEGETLALAQAFASYAAVAVANVALHSSTAQLAEQLREALDSRAVIEQAKGVLMARTGCSADEAFAELTRRSQRANRKLRAVAADLVQHPQDG